MAVSGDSTHSTEERKNKPEDTDEIMHVAPVLYFHMSRPWTFNMCTAKTQKKHQSWRPRGPVSKQHFHVSFSTNKKKDVEEKKLWGAEW
ncbi:hypothetical protein IRJ41_019677 [Triplophysa rosa]|uniref:Uncharacterized protein n=1 Tax=Triplophysa rosa TaxID=992332 RepID=A0A9W7WHJ9_TRIRA|nr:hypothetical protein IRJ41_019677 [Triplophysa rosa]